MKQSPVTCLGHLLCHACEQITQRTFTYGVTDVGIFHIGISNAASHHTTSHHDMTCHAISRNTSRPILPCAAVSNSSRSARVCVYATHLSFSDTSSDDAPGRGARADSYSTQEHVLASQPIAHTRIMSAHLPCLLAYLFHLFHQRRIGMLLYL